MSNLPASYIDLGHVAMHVAELRKYTTDLDRFLRHMPLVQELDGVAAGSAEAWAILDKADDIDSFALSLREHGALLLDGAASLQAELHRRKGQ